MYLSCYQAKELESALASAKEEAADTTAKLAAAEASNRQQQEEVNLCRVMLVRR
jgi:hypothetical protein